VNLSATGRKGADLRERRGMFEKHASASDWQRT
jgi:hypothetical protein